MPYLEHPLAFRYPRPMSMTWTTPLRGLLAALLSAACLAVPTVADAMLVTARPSAAVDLEPATVAAETESLIVADADGNLWLAAYEGKNPYNGADVYALAPRCYSRLPVWLDPKLKASARHAAAPPRMIGVAINQGDCHAMDSTLKVGLACRGGVIAELMSVIANGAALPVGAA